MSAFLHVLLLASVAMATIYLHGTSFISTQVTREKLEFLNENGESESMLSACVLQRASFAISIKYNLYVWGLYRGAHFDTPTMINGTQDRVKLFFKTHSSNNCLALALNESLLDLTYTGFSMYEGPLDVAHAERGVEHVLIKQADGSAVCIGRSDFGQCGIGNLIATNFAKISLHDNAAVNKIAAGSYFSMILTRDNVLYMFGSNR